MARLVTVTEEQYNGKTHSTALSKAYGAKFIKSFVDNSGDTTVTLDGRNEKDIRVVSQSVATLKTAFNAAETTVTTSAFAITLTVKRLQGQTVDGSTATVFPTRSIVEILPDPDDAADSLVVVRDDNALTDTIYVVDETVAAILALSEA